MKVFVFIACLLLFSIALSFSCQDLYSIGESAEGIILLLQSMLLFLSPAKSPLFLFLPNLLRTIIAIAMAALVLRRFYFIFQKRSLAPPPHFKGVTYGMASIALLSIFLAAIMMVLMPLAAKGGGASFLSVYLVLVPASILLPLSILSSELQSLRAGT